MQHPMRKLVAYLSQAHGSCTRRHTIWYFKCIWLYRACMASSACGENYISLNISEYDLLKAAKVSVMSLRSFGHCLILDITLKLRYLHSTKIAFTKVYRLSSHIVQPLGIIFINQQSQWALFLFQWFTCSQPSCRDLIQCCRHDQMVELSTWFWTSWIRPWSSHFDFCSWTC